MRAVQIRMEFWHPTTPQAWFRGICGLSGDVYCTTCDRVSDVILVEFLQPTDEKLAMWAGALEPKDKYKREGAVGCPHCRCNDLLLEPPRSSVVCPRCGKDELTGRMTVIS